MSGEYSAFGLDWTFVADADLSGDQFRFVAAASTAGNVKRATSASVPIPIGVLQNKPKAGESAAVRISGVTLVKANAATAINHGDYLTAGADGQAVKASGSAAAAIALESLSSGSGVVIKALLLPGAYRFS